MRAPRQNRHNLSDHAVRLFAGFSLLVAAHVVAMPAMAASAGDVPIIEAQASPNQGISPPGKSPRADMPAPPADLQKPSKMDRTRGLDFLLGALKAAPDATSARHVEKRIWALWTATSSDTVTLLMERANAAIAAKEFDLALQLLDAVVKLRPDYIEGWNRRANVYYVKDRYLDALADIQQVLALEPRHFAALTGLGLIMKELGDERRALIALRHALELDPHMERVPGLVKTLTDKIEGRGI